MYSYNGEAQEKWAVEKLLSFLFHSPLSECLEQVKVCFTCCSTVYNVENLSFVRIIYIFESYCRLIWCLQGKIYNSPSCILFISVTKYLLQVQKIKKIRGPFQQKKSFSSLNYVYIIQAK